MIRRSSGQARPGGDCGAALTRTSPDPFSDALIEARQTGIFERLGTSALVLPAAPLLRKSRDTDVRYRPGSELAYATGVRDPDVVAVFLGHADKERLVLFAPEADPKRQLWTGSAMDVEAAAAVPGVDRAMPIAELHTQLPELLRGSRYVHARMEEHAEVDRAVRQALATARFRGSKDGTGPRGVLDPGLVLDEMRLVKGPEELATMRAAAEISRSAFADVLPRARAGQGEWQVEAALDGAFRDAGAWGPAYPTIVGSGPNACVLHHTQNHRVLEDGDLVLVDAGAEWNLYASDITRTVPVNGRFSPEQRALYEIVSEAQAAAVQVVRPGATLDQVHETALERMVSGLRELGILKGEAKHLIETGAHKPFVPHSTSHWLGLDVHDVGDYVVDGASRSLQPGMVFSVEPGIYLAEGAEAVPVGFRGLGVRVEDEVLVTDDGFENLTGSLPRTADAVEEWLS